MQKLLKQPLLTSAGGELQNMTKSEESISKALNLSLKNPKLFIPALVPIIVGTIFNFLAYVFATKYYIGMVEVTVPNMYISLGGSLIAYVLGAIAGFVVVDMANDLLNDRPADLKKSLNLALSKFGTLILAAVIAALLSITIILLPMALFIITIVVVDGVNAIEGTKRSFNFVIKNLKESIIFILIVIIVQVIFSLVLSVIPMIGSYIAGIVGWLLNIMFLVASVCFYHALRGLPPPT